MFGICKKSTVCLFCFVSMPVFAQNMASIEAPMGYPIGVSLAYGIDYHPERYILIKPSVSASLNKGDIFSVRYALAFEHRYYYNIIKRQSKGKKTLHKSADFISVKPSWEYWSFKDYEYYRMNHIYFCSINWGLRRAMGRRFYFESSIGVGPLYNKNEMAWFLHGDFRLSIGVQLF